MDLSPYYPSLITEALRREDGNQSGTTRMLGIIPQALHKRLKQQGND